MSILLSQEQKDALSIFEQWMEAEDQPFMVLAGAAGTGKTTLLRYIVQVLDANQKLRHMIDPKAKSQHLYFTATTNKAVEVLKNAVQRPTITIHSLLGLSVKKNFQTGREDLRPKRGTEPKHFTSGLIVIDEASMIGHSLFNWIRIARQESCKVLFVGDPYQLAPVLERPTEVFERVTPKVELKEIQRQARNSPIITASHAFRDLLRAGEAPSAQNPWPMPQSFPGVLEHLDGPAFQRALETRYLECWKSPFDIKHDAAQRIRTLAYTNARVLSYNAHMRQLLGFPAEFMPGEWVITNELIEMFGTVIYPNESLIQIQSTEPAISSDGIPGYMVYFRKGKIFQAKDPMDRIRLLKQFQKMKDWKEYFRIKAEYADLRAIHAQTCHKAQGSTYDWVAVDLQDIGRNNRWQEIARLVYVAISRAKDKVYLYGELPYKNWQ